MDFTVLKLFKEQPFSVKLLSEKFFLIIIGFAFVFKVNISTPAILLLLLFNISFKTQPIISIKQKYLSIVFFSLYLLFFSSFLLTKEETSSNLIKTAGFIFIPLLFYLKRFNKNEIFVFIYSFVAFQIIHIIYVDYVMIDAIFFDKINDYDSITELVQRKFIIERPYFSLNCLLTMVCLKFAFDEKKISLFITMLLFLFITISLFLIGARLAMGVSLLLFFLIVLRTKVINKKHFLILISSFLILLIPVSKYTLERIFLKRGEPRIVIWDCAYKIINEKDFNYLIGEFSEVKSNQKQVDCYNSKEVISGPYWWIGTNKYNYNSHNQFLGFFMNYGLLGLLMFLSIFVIQVYDFVKRDNYISLLIVAVFFFQCIFENIISRNLGIYLFLWFNYFFIPQKRQYEQ